MNSLAAPAAAATAVLGVLVVVLLVAVAVLLETDNGLGVVRTAGGEREAAALRGPGRAGTA